MSEERGPELGSGRSRVSGGRRRIAGYRSRSERRSVRRAARRRRATGRLFRYVGPVVVLILVAVALFVVWGGPESGRESQTAPTTTVMTGPTSIGALLVVAQRGEAAALLLFVARDQGGVALALPGAMLAKTDSGFKTLKELHGSKRPDLLLSALAGMLGESVEAVASVEWSDLRQAVMSKVPSGAWPSELNPTEDGAATALDAVMAYVGAEGGGEAEAALGQLDLGDGGASFRAAVGAMTTPVSAETWSGSVIPGRSVEGEGFSYYEPNVDMAKAALAGENAGPMVTLEVQNGSGVLEAAEEAGRLLEWPRWTQLPYRNSPDFPDVRQTRILTASDVRGEAGRVRALLGVGTIEVDAGLEPGHIVVVVGVDFIPPRR